MLLRRHMSFYLAAIGGAAAFVIAWLLGSRLTPVIGANAFFVLYLALAIHAMSRLSADYLKKHAASADEPVWIIFLVTFAAAVVAVVSLFILINQKPRAVPLDLIVTLAAVPLGWATIHMMAALHYAHVYWQPDDTINARAGAKPSAKGGKVAHRRGFEFPGTSEPCGWDFAYYAFVIGMTAQTSDTGVTTTAMRRMTLVHGIVSYFFNTVLVAAAVNVAVALGS